MTGQGTSICLNIHSPIAHISLNTLKRIFISELSVNLPLRILNAQTYSQFVRTLSKALMSHEKGFQQNY